MIGKPNDQGSMVQMVSLEELVPQGHFLRKLDRVLDLSFVQDLLSPAYHPSQGREGIAPKLAVRMILLGYLFDLSEVRLCEEVRLHAGYRWFCRLDFHDVVPDRTTLVKFRGRCRAHRLWKELFHRIVTQCGEVGLLSGRHLMVDSTQVAAPSIKSLEEIQSDLTQAADRLCSDEKKNPSPAKTTIIITLIFTANALPTKRIAPRATLMLVSIVKTKVKRPSSPSRRTIWPTPRAGSSSPLRRPGYRGMMPPMVPSH